MKYTLDNLEWQQFEELAFKCLQYDISPSINFIEGGNDKGRDFTYNGITKFFSDHNQNQSIVFQAKHKTGTKAFSNLKQDLSRELQKTYVEHQFEYDVYCLVTNLTISGNQLDKLQSVFNSFFEEFSIKFKVDFKIYSYRQFELCIDKNEKLKSVFPTIVNDEEFENILSKIIERDKENIFKGWVSIFRRNSEYFVYTSIYQNAVDKLCDNNILLLAGPSKSGKTFTAEMVVFYLYSQEEYIPLKIDRIEEFDQFYNPKAKQVFLFDDAFGRYNIDQVRADTFNRKLEYIFELIDDSHKCIFTSREYIYKAFLNYSESDLQSYISKITVKVANLTDDEKESILRRYYRLSIEKRFTVSERGIELIINHKNFSPELVRAYFYQHNSFVLNDFLQHLEIPDEYLEKDFNNLTDIKKVILLSTLLSHDGTVKEIAYCFKNICGDLNIAELVSLEDELNQLDGSLLSLTNNEYKFYHPSMFEFFIRYISKDVSTYRIILFKNININLLNALRFKPLDDENAIEINYEEIAILIEGIGRFFNKQLISLTEINSILYWLASPNVQLYLKIKKIEKYKELLDKCYRLVEKTEKSVLTTSNIESIDMFLRLISSHHQSFNIKKDILEDFLINQNDKNKFWLLVFRIIPFYNESEIFNIVDRSWFVSFYRELKGEILSLGLELFGDAFPAFNDIQEYQKLIEEEKLTEAKAVQRKNLVDFKQNTNRTWYPRYEACKEKMKVLKSSHPHGFKLYEELISNFDKLQRFEENQRKRYYYNKQQKWW